MAKNQTDLWVVATMLYKPTPKVALATRELIKVLNTPTPRNNVMIRSLSFAKGALKLANLEVKSVVVTDNHLMVEIHWYPQPKISTTEDPFCSVMALRYNSIVKLTNFLKTVTSKM